MIGRARFREIKKKLKWSGKMITHLKWSANRKKEEKKWSTKWSLITVFGQKTWKKARCTLQMFYATWTFIGSSFANVHARSCSNDLDFSNISMHIVEHWAVNKQVKLSEPCLSVTPSNEMVFNHSWGWWQAPIIVRFEFVVLFEWSVQ